MMISSLHNETTEENGMSHAALDVSISKLSLNCPVICMKRVMFSLIISQEIKLFVHDLMRRTVKSQGGSAGLFFGGN